MFLKTRRDRSKRYVEVMIDVGSSLLNRPSLKPLKRDTFALGLARFGARVGAASAIARDVDFLLLSKGFWTLLIALLLISAWSIRQLIEGPQIGVSLGFRTRACPRHSV